MRTGGTGVTAVYNEYALPGYGYAECERVGTYAGVNARVPANCYITDGDWSIRFPVRYGALR